MTKLLLCITLLSVSTLAFSALVDNRYAGPHSANSLNSRGRYQPAGVHSLRGPSSPAIPSRPAHPGVPSIPRQPSGPSAPRQPAGPHYRAPPAAYGTGRPYGTPSQYSAPAPVSYGAPQNSYGAHQSSYGSSLSRGPSHYGGPNSSVYQPQRPVRATNNYAQPQQTSSYRSESQSQSHGREMKYTIRDPQNRGTTHVTETHIVSNKQMHGAEAEAAMKKLMGSMGPGLSYGSDGGFQDFVKNMGLPFY